MHVAPIEAEAAGAAGEAPPNQPEARTGAEALISEAQQAPVELDAG